MELAVVIPTKNEAKTIPYLINSIREQTFKNLEIIVADSPLSTDGTKDVAKRYGCYIVKGGTLSRGRNSGADEAVRMDFENISWIDADAILPNRNFLENLLNEFYERKLDFAGTLQIPYDSKNLKEIDLNNVIETTKKTRDWRFNALYNLTNFGMKILQNSKKYPAMQQCMIAKSEMYEIFGGFDEKVNFGEDSDFSERAVKVGYKFGILEKPGKVFTWTRRFEGNFWNLTGHYILLNAGRRVFKKAYLHGKYDYYKLGNCTS